MDSLNLEQRKILAGFFSNIGVGWFGAGIISPFLAKPSNALDLYSHLIWGLFMAYVFLRVALSLME